MSIKLSELLPPPSAPTDEWSSIRRDPWFRGKEDALTSGSSSTAVVIKEPPPYGKRKGWIPRSPEDFGDGGAFPEIPVAQFPLGMGMDAQRRTGSEKTIALQYDAEGKLRHDAIARIGHAKDKIIYSRLSDMKSKVIDEEDESFQRPDEETIAERTESTRLALEKITASKVASALPVRHAEKQAPVQYIRYTPSQQGGGHNSGAQQRIIRMVEEQKDPMEPPKFRINQKIPRAPPSPPAPVMHSPTRKTTVKEQADWKIPPCISNWKNPKGYTVALDKRLAADGRGLQQVHINENFAKLAESLYLADRTAREAVETRAQMERRVAQNKKAEQEEKMRLMAQKARQERIQMKKVHEGEGASEEAREREQIRRDRLDEHRRERNIARNNPDKLERLKRGKERDISEKIALGLPDSRARNGDTQFDQRLFDQTKGLDSGGIDDETYSAYDKPWRAQDNIQQHIYRPSKNLDKDLYGDDLDRIISTNRFVPDKGFSGTEGGATRTAGPVQFEKDEEDIFGLGQLLQSAKEVKKRGAEGGDEASSSKKRR
uniref:SKI-interacting protein SKIP SNW domain-containing protein n=1 Tax=Ascaris suum TaxID=6253 RepID=F1L1L4_ASCSU